MVLYPLDHEEYRLVMDALKCKCDTLEADIRNFEGRTKKSDYVQSCINRRYDKIYRYQSIMISLRTRHDICTGQYRD